jgi:hypothetical protein
VPDGAHNNAKVVLCFRSTQPPHKSYAHENALITSDLSPHSQ